MTANGLCSSCEQYRSICARAGGPPPKAKDPERYARLEQLRKEYRLSVELKRDVKATEQRENRAKVCKLYAQNGGAKRARTRKYGITPEQYDALLATQRGVCAIEGCGNSPEHQSGRSLAIDHCHKTGKVRGLLCIACNVAIGYLELDPDYVSRLKKYLELTR